jgi:phytanoyl-CoA hydroxylase
MATKQKTTTSALSDEPVFDRYILHEYPEHLFSFDNVASGIEGSASFTDDHVRYYQETGFLAINNFFTKREIDSALAGLTDLIDGKNPAARSVVVQYEAITRDRLGTSSVEERRDMVRKLHGFVDDEPRLRAIADHPQLRETVGRLLGTTEPALYQDQAMLKPRGIGREKPWHQDHAFFDLPLGTPIIGCWIALDEAKPENGCMHVKPGTHKEGPVVHFERRDWQICDEHLDLTRDVMVPLKPGGILFFNGLTHHGTPANRTAERRRALQLHYIPAGTPRTSKEARMTIFGTEGKDITC